MLKKGIAAFIVLLLLYTVAGFFILPAILRPELEKKLSIALDRKVSIREIAFNPFALSVDVKGFSIREKGGGEPFFSFDELYLNAQARSLIKGGPVVREVTLTGPRVAITRLDAKRYNFSDLLEKKKTSPAKDKPKKSLRFSVGNIVVKNGLVQFTDHFAHTSHKAERINLSIPFLSNLDEFLDVYVQPRFSAIVNGTPFTLAGSTKPFKDSLETSLDLNLAGISLPFYMGYLPPDLRLGVTSGILGIKARLSYIQYKGRKPSLTVLGTLGLKSLTVQDKDGKPLLSLPAASLSLAPSPLTDRLVHIGKVEITSPEVFINKDKSGKLNLASIAPPSGKKPKEQKDKGSPFVVKLDGFSITGGAVRFTDSSKSSPVSLALEEMAFFAKDLSTRPDSRGSFGFSSKVNDRCTVKASASLVLKPLTCEAKLDVAGFEPAWVQPYFTDRIRIFITRGSLSTAGSLRVEKKGTEKPVVAFAGNAALADFASLDKTSSDDFLRCRTLSLDRLKLNLNPDSLDIGTVLIKDLYSRILVAKDGSVNLATIVNKDGAKAGAAPAPAPEGKKAPMKIAVGKISVDNARVLFLDKSVRGGYSAELSRLKGTVKGISTSRLARADVNLSGMLNRTAPVLITGRINPFKENLFVNLHTSITGLDLSPMTPYSGRYVGYAVEKGKLSLDLTYNINHKDLDSRNNVFIDQFTFGQRVESPTATKLPVRFAVALLRDAQGRIDLKIPVKGRTDDPKFSVWGVIVTILKNLVVKAATSPFLLLEAMYPGATQANTVEFAYGSSDLPDGAAAKLAPLLKILEDKPSLNLEIRGSAEPDQDLLGLKNELFEKKIKAQKLKALLQGGQAGISLRDVTVSPEEYPVYLKKAYKAEGFAKPKNFIGMPLDLPPAEMERLIREHIEVTGSDLRLLAMSRAQKVEAYLSASGKVAPSRLFLMETGDGASEHKQGVKGSRVELVLK
jgi:hypothetical protein